MGFMDKAKQMAQQVQQEAKDGTLKERAKAMAEQAQQKLDEVQGQFNESQQQAGQAAPAAAPQYDQHGRPVPPQPMASPDPTPAGAPPQAVPESETATGPGGDPLADAAKQAPKTPPSPGSGMTSGDPLAG